MKLVNIDKDVPMPTQHGSTLYPWDSMEVGDSFLVIGGKMTGSGTATKRYAPKVFSQRKTVDGYRVWRVE